MRVFVVAVPLPTEKDGFVDPEAQRKTKALNDSVKDFRDAISGKKKVLQLTDHRGEAAVVVEVFDRALKATGNKLTTPASLGGLAPAREQDEMRETLSVRIIAGEYRKDEHRVSDDAFCGYRCLAGRLTDTLIKFVETNRERLAK